ncbi:MAG: ATP-binding protein [Trueperaceae bacterium]
MNKPTLPSEGEVPSGRAQLMRKLLIGLLFLLLIATALDVVVEGRSALTLEGLAANMLVAAVLGVGLWLLGKGHLKSVVALVAGIIMLLAAESLWDGISGRAASLLLFVAPITLVGLLMGRWALYLTAAVSVAFVATVYWLEASGSPFIVTPPEPRTLLDTVLLFAIIVGLLVLFLDRFALTLQEALAKSSLREAELRREMNERKSLETRLQLATDSAQVGLWSWDPDSEEVEWSLQMKNLFGLPADAEVSIETFLERVHPEDRDRIATTFGEVENGGGRPYRICLPEGQVRWILGRGKNITLPSGQHLALGAAYEVTALIEAEAERDQLLGKEQEARREAERVGERLAFLADAGRILAEALSYRKTLVQLAELAVPRLADWCAIDVLNPDGLLERLAVMHSDPEKVRFAHDLQRLYPPDPAATTGAYQVLKSGEPRLMEDVGEGALRAAAQDERHLEMLRGVGFSSAIIAPLISRGTPLGALILVQAESGRHYDSEDLDLAMQLAERAAIAVDNARLYGEATELNAELEERVEARTEELRTANTELESFTYSASHDLRAPLRGINGFSQALLDDYGDRLDEKGHEYLRRIHGAAMRMGDLIDDLLELSRISKTELTVERVDISALADEVVQGIRQQDPEREVHVEIQEDMRAKGDARLLRIALENLLGNAWKFTVEREEARIEVKWDESKGAYYVRDNGAGFSMDYANKLFVPFQRLHPPDSFAGTGIGLATTMRVIERHGGDLWGEGKEGRGATFYFTLSRQEA